MNDQTNEIQGIKMLEQIIEYQPLFNQDKSALFYTDEETGHIDCLMYSEQFREFIQALYEKQFLIEYDWMSRGAWGERYFEDLKRLEEADLLTLRMLLFAAVRNDRFCDGYLGSLGRDGQLYFIMQRLGKIYDELRSGRMEWQRVTCGPLPDIKKNHPYSFDNFDRMYWVDPGRLLAGDYPGDLDPLKAKEKLNFLVSSGIRQVVNLMEKDEVNYSGQPFRPYDHKLQKLAKQNGSDVKITNIEIKDLTVPSKAQMLCILNTIDQAHKEDRPVYVHCWGGHGRTGTVAGCYLVRNDIVSSKGALDYLKKIRRDIVKGDMPSPQTPDQRAMVRNWRVGL